MFDELINLIQVKMCLPLKVTANRQSTAMVKILQIYIASHYSAYSWLVTKMNLWHQNG